MSNYNGALYAVGVGNYIAYVGTQFHSMGKAMTETTFEVTSSALDIRAGKRAPLRCRYNHSTGLNINFISAEYNPDLWMAAFGSTARGDSNGSITPYGNLPYEETITFVGGTATLTYTPIAVGEIPANVWLNKDGVRTVVTPSGKTITAPEGWETATVCALYQYKSLKATSFSIPANIKPQILHVFLDVDLATDKSGSGIIGRSVIEIPLLQLDANQTFNAVMDGYTESKITGMALVDTSSASGCSGDGDYAFINTEIFDSNWYDNVYRITNDIDNVEVVQSGTYSLQLLALYNDGRYASLDSDFYGSATGQVKLTFTEGTATGSTFNATTGVFTAGTTNGTSTVEVEVVGVSTIPTYTLEIEVVSA